MSRTGAQGVAPRSRAPPAGGDALSQHEGEGSTGGGAVVQQPTISSDDAAHESTLTALKAGRAAALSARDPG
ncbi:MAG: hypothetical protein WA892_07510 [Ornithinimicrobium sp.]